jgi:predicted PurR-regulated permease PerM
MEVVFRSNAQFVIGVVFLYVALATSIFLVPDVFLLIFAGILVAIFLRSLTDALEGTTGIPAGWSLGIVVLSLGGLFAATIYLMAPSITDQFDALMQQIPESAERLRTQIERYSWGRNFLDKAEPEHLSGRSSSLMTGVGGAFSSILNWATNLLVIFFVGLYGAIEPGVYKRGFLYLIPPERRGQIAQVISECNVCAKSCRRAVLSTEIKNEFERIRRVIDTYVTELWSVFCI